MAAPTRSSLGTGTTRTARLFEVEGGRSERVNGKLLDHINEDQQAAHQASAPSNRGSMDAPEARRTRSSPGCVADSSIALGEPLPRPASSPWPWDTAKKRTP